MKTQIKKDHSISCARFIAMCFIVACHIMQRDDFASNINGAHIGWAFWFNIGVQMFLFISGFLYGKKDKVKIVEFYKKNFPKILIDYYVFVLLMLLLIRLYPLLIVDNDSVMKLLTFSGTIAGLGHLWFVRTILFCYLLAPVCIEIVNTIDKHSDARFFIESIMLVVISHIIIKHHFGVFTPAWVNCFLVGILYSRVENRKRIRRIFLIITIISCIVIIPFQFRIDYWPHEELPEFFSIRYSHFVQYGHDCLGVLLVIVIRCFYNRIIAKYRKHRILEWSDKYSYDVYLVHHVFIQSAFGCVEFIDNRIIAIPLAIASTIISAILLHAISAFIKEKCLLIYRNIPN